MRTTLAIVTFFMATLLLAGLPSLAAADVAQVEGLLRRAAVNLENVEQNVAGRDAWPKGSAGKLLARRLEQVGGDLQPAGELVAQLPAGGEGVAQVTQQYNDMIARYHRLVALQNGGAAPPPDTGPAEGTVKLGYPHADNLKNAVFTLEHKVESAANQLTEFHAKLLPIEDQLTINYRQTGAALNTIKEGRRQAGFVEEALAKVPANGQGVAPAKARLAAGRETFDGAEKYFAPLHAKLMTIVDPAQYPDFRADVERLKGISSDYGADYVFTSDRARAAELYAQRQPAQAELVRIATAYQRPLQQNPDWIKPLEIAGNSALGNFQEFDAAVEEQKQGLPGEVREHLAKADQQADDAVQNQKPLWFTGGIPQEMGYADDKTTLLQAIDPAAGNQLREEYDQLQASLQERAKSLEELIIQENQPPSDNFAGEDRQKAIDTAIDAWKYQEKDFEVLGAAIPAEAWERQEKHFFDGQLEGDGDVSGTWSKQDRSRLQVQLFIAVKDQPTLAKIIPVNVYKDHMKGDTMIGTPLFAGDEELQPRFFLLRDKLDGRGS
jgi:hypothetical protein